MDGAAGVQTYETMSTPSTPYQIARLREVERSAAAASAAATPALLALLDSSRLRAHLRRCCADIAKESARELLERLRTETRALEVVTGIASSGGSGSFAWDVTVSQAQAAGRLDNQWANRFVHGGAFSARGWFGVQDDVEVNAYGLHPFSSRARPSSLAEANERAVYHVVNSMRSDAGSPLYGNVSVVLSPSVRNTTLYSAIDTGEWAWLCNRSELTPPRARTSSPRKARAGWGPYSPECAAYNFSLGTHEHFDHLFLANADYWKENRADAIAARLRWLLYPWQSPLFGYQLTRYWEAMPAATLQFPAAVHFVIALFGPLFGTDEGAGVREWCIRNGWILVWSLGLNTDDAQDFWSVGWVPSPFPSNARFLDVPAATAANRTISAHARAAYDRSWRDASATRAAGGALGNATWSRLWRAAAGALPSSLRLRPARAADCARIDACVGVDFDGDCVCGADGGAGDSAATRSYVVDSVTA